MPSVSKQLQLQRSVTRMYDNGVRIVEFSSQAQHYIDKSWDNTPNYRAVKASSQRLPENGFIFRECKGNGGYAVFRQESLGLTYLYSRGYWLFPSFPTGTNDHVYYGVQSDLIKQAKGQRWNVPVFVAEGRKTTAMVYGRALHLVSMMRALRRGNFGEFVVRFHPSAAPPSKRRISKFHSEFGRNPSGAAANAWLEFRYGWLPFVSEVRNAVNTLMDVVDKPKNRIGTVRSRRSQFFIQKGSSLMYQDGFNRCWCRYTADTRLSARATWLFKPLDSDLPSRFGLVNPLEVAWELLPYSFVVDWFLPVGDYLSALDAPFLFQHQGGSLGQRAYTVTDVQPHEVTGDWKLVGGGGSGSTALGVWRQPFSSVPKPELLKLSFNAQLGAARVTSAIALLRQAASRLGR